MSEPNSEGRNLDVHEDRLPIPNPYRASFRNIDVALEREPVKDDAYVKIAGSPAKQRGWIQKLMLALNGPAAGPPATVTDERLQVKWREGQQYHHSLLVRMLYHEEGQKAAEKRMWLLLDYVYRLHSIEYAAHAKENTMCSFKTMTERLDRMIEIIKGHPMIGIRVLKGITMDLFAADPQTILEAVQEEIVDFAELQLEAEQLIEGEQLTDAEQRQRSMAPSPTFASNTNRAPEELHDVEDT
ncbi:hypothetical protein LTR56_007605 [Elasticomyces elasticus]|nr:hypothetical protein LTR56_007605 [Elasticomyces elasticus]KAK3665306.1 hypothetical protein LTR22_003828 [Elasticomyces elasticus]KAK4929721.1 hypothetical protein LTR49_003679 [Elasticomyces elasticus]KAK5761059.1 hypothetical protein LTS12_008736 [Elasticomyces elasticus]